MRGRLFGRSGLEPGRARPVPASLSMAAWGAPVFRGGRLARPARDGALLVCVRPSRRPGRLGSGGSRVMVVGSFSSETRERRRRVSAAHAP